MAVSSPVILEAEEIGSPVTHIRVKWYDPAYGTANAATGFKLIHDDETGTLPAWSSAVDAALAGGGDGAGNYEVLLPVPLGGVATWWEDFEQYATGDALVQTLDKGGSIWDGAWVQWPDLISADPHSLDIVDRTISSEENKRLKYVNTATSRKLAIGDDWTKIRIGFTISASTGTATSGPGAMRWMFGLQNGTTYIPGSIFGGTDASLHEVCLDMTSGASVFGTTRWNITFPGGANIAKIRVWENGTATNNNAAAASGTWLLSKSESLDPAAVYIDISKGATWSFMCWLRNAVLESQFKADMDASTPSSFSIRPLGTSGLTGVSVDEAIYGALDTVFFYAWSTSTVIEIGDFAVRKIS